MHAGLPKRRQCPCHAISGFACGVGKTLVILTNIMKHIHYIDYDYTWLHYIVLPCTTMYYLTANKVKTYFTPAHMRTGSDSWCSSRQNGTEVSASRVDHQLIYISKPVRTWSRNEGNWVQLSGCSSKKSMRGKDTLRSRVERCSKQQRQVLVVAPPLHVVMLQRPQPCAGQQPQLAFFYLRKVTNVRFNASSPQSKSK